MTAEKISEIVGVLSKLRYFMPQCIKKLLYNSLFFSVISYCFLVWGTTTFSNIHKLHVIQKRAIRIIANIPYDAHTKSVFETHKILPIPQLYKNILVKRYNMSIRQHNMAILNLSQLQRKVHTHDIRSTCHWIIPQTRTNYGRQMLRFNLPSLLNNLSVD
ncbi:unnamed protein product [Ixodes persulcatus]